MTADWFATAKPYLALPAHGCFVHHVKGHEMQAILNSTNYDSLLTPQDWEFEVLTKKVVFHAHHWGSTTTTPDTTTVPEPSIHTLTSRLETKGVLTPKTKGATLPNDHKRSVKRNVARSKTTHKRAKIEAKASIVYSDLVLDNEEEAPYKRIEDLLTPPTKPAFHVAQKNGRINANTLTQLTADLVALHIGQSPTNSAIMLVDSGASHILVRLEHAHDLHDVIMSGPNTKAFANLKPAKNGSELSAIGRGCLHIGQFRLPAFMFSNDSLEDTLLGLDPLTAQSCTAIFTHESFHLYYKTNPESILSGSKTSNQQPTLTDDALAPHVPSAFGDTLQNSRQTDNEYFQFVHASLDFPPQLRS
jgi:hypothetical protein